MKWYQILVCKFFHTYWHKWYWSHYDTHFYECLRCHRHWAKPR